MKSYESPVVLTNDELSEGVYAASGVSSDCWELIRVECTNNIVPSESSREIQINAVHHNASDTHYAKVVITITFNQTVTNVISNSGMETVVNISGNTAQLARTFTTNNDGENWGFAIRVVCPDPSAVVVENAYLTCV